MSAMGVAIHVFRGLTEQLTNQREFSKVQDFADYLSTAIDYYEKAVAFDPDVSRVIVSYSIHGHLYETHIEMVRGEVKASEHDVTPQFN